MSDEEKEEICCECGCPSVNCPRCERTGQIWLISNGNGDAEGEICPECEGTGNEVYAELRRWRRQVDRFVALETMTALVCALYENREDGPALQKMLANLDVSVLDLARGVRIEPPWAGYPEAILHKTAVLNLADLARCRDLAARIGGPLEFQGESDYLLPDDGGTIWITVGAVSLYLRQVAGRTDGSRVVQVSLYRNGDEMGEELDSCEAEC